MTLSTSATTEPTDDFRLNMDFAERLAINTETMDWIASPSGKVWRKPLEREAAEHGHTSSIVRYEPGSSFPAPLGCG